MADVIVSKIQHRRGLRRDLPQPLDPGELGYCTDTGQVFIGSEKPTEEQYSLHSLSVILYDNEVSLETVANEMIRLNVFQFNDIASEDELLGDFNKTVKYTDSEGVQKLRGYSAYTSSQAETPNSFVNASGIAFNRGSLDLQLSDIEYILDDSYAIAELMNLIYGDGLVTTQQNIEILTDFSDLAGLSTPRAEIILPADNSEPVLSYDLEENDSFIVEYSLYDSDGTAYSRVGRLNIVTFAGTATLFDDYSEMIDSSVVVDFTSDVDVENGKVNVYYTTTSTLEFIFTTNTRKWKSF